VADRDDAPVQRRAPGGGGRADGGRRRGPRRFDVRRRERPARRDRRGHRAPAARGGGPRVIAGETGRGAARALSGAIRRRGGNGCRRAPLGWNPPLPRTPVGPMRATAPSLAILLGLLAFARPAHAQAVVTGTTGDGEGTLPGVNVVATRLAPDSTRSGTVSGLDGAFRLTLSEGTYHLRFSFVGYEPAEREVTVRGEAVDLGRIVLALDVVVLDEAVVEAVQARVTLRGDTTAYNAAAFRVNPDASAEDLVAKLPGVVVQDGEVQAEGEAVRRVLVDGEEFFGDDPTAALRNLPAEIIQEIQVFDRQSDQARFTGFDDGNEEKTINVVTRADRRNGQFGRVHGGAGLDGRYNAGAALNVFDGSRRITLLGL